MIFSLTYLDHPLVLVLDYIYIQARCVGQPISLAHPNGLATMLVLFFFFFQIIYDNTSYTLIFFIEKYNVDNVLFKYVGDDALLKSDN